MARVMKGKRNMDTMGEEFLINLGLNVYRISDFRVKHDLDNVMKELENYIIQEFGSLA